MYCQSGDQPKILYKFSDSGQKTYVSRVAPISVFVTGSQPGYNGGQCAGIDYKVDVVYETYADVGSYPPGYIITVYAKGPIGEFFNVNHRNRNGYIGGIAFRSGSGESKSSLTSGTGNIFTNKPKFVGITRQDGKPDNCGDYAGLCTLEIKHNGQTIFSDQGSCGCNFQVQCGGDDDCPPGTCKCPSPGYPGYCCIDCSQVGRRITNLASRF